MGKQEVLCHGREYGMLPNGKQEALCHCREYMSNGQIEKHFAMVWNKLRGAECIFCDDTASLNMHDSSRL